MKSAKEIIGVNIKFQRNKKKYTQQDLADLLGVDRQYVWRMENGKVNMTLDYLDSVIDKLNCQHDDFIFILPLVEPVANSQTKEAKAK